MLINVTAMATDSVATALSVATTFTVVGTMLSHKCEHRCHLTPLSQRCQCHRCHSAVSCHRCHTSVRGNVTVFSLSPLLHRCQFTSLTYCCCHRCRSAVRATAVTAQLSTPLSQYCHYHRYHTCGNCHCCDISVDSSVIVVQISTAVPPLWDSSCVRKTAELGKKPECI